MPGRSSGGSCSPPSPFWPGGFRVSVRPHIGWRPTVDIYVCTYDEGLDVLGATLVGCDRITYPHTTWVLDDGRREEVRLLADRFGARYLSRPTNEHAKAGNINHALGLTDGQLLLILDADHVPQPDILDATVGYFDDPAVAVVQTPHDFGNHDSFQHFETGRHDQSMFFEVIMVGKDRHDGAFWCGSAALILRHALEGIGGIATETVAEDFHTTIRLHARAGTPATTTRPWCRDWPPTTWPRSSSSGTGGPAATWPFCGPGRTHWWRPAHPQAAGQLSLLPSGLLRPPPAPEHGGRSGGHAGQRSPSPARHPVAVLYLLDAVDGSQPGRFGGALCRGQASLWDGAYSNLLTTEIFTRAAFVLIHPFRTAFKVTPKDGVDDGGWPAVRQLRLIIVMALALLRSGGGSMPRSGRHPRPCPPPRPGRGGRPRFRRR